MGKRVVVHKYGLLCLTEDVFKALKQEKINRYHIVSVVRLFVNYMIEDLSKNDTTNIPGFGHFYSKKRKEIEYISKITNTKQMSNSRKLDYFKLGQVLKQLMLKNIDAKSLTDPLKNRENNE